jgi:hypothetical protein
LLLLRGKSVAEPGNSPPEDLMREAAQGRAGADIAPNGRCGERREGVGVLGGDGRQAPVEVLHQVLRVGVKRWVHP